MNSNNERSPSSSFSMCAVSLSTRAAVHYIPPPSRYCTVYGIQMFFLILTSSEDAIYQSELDNA